MNILVLLRMVPDTVEELVISSNEKSLDKEATRYILNEMDEHALEEALLLKERHKCSVTTIALDTPEVDNALYTAIAKGADKAIKISGDWEHLSTPLMASIFANHIMSNRKSASFDLILVGTQSSEDISGQLAPLIARKLNLPYVSVVNKISIDTSLRTANVIKEFGRGLQGEYCTPLPAVLCIISAEKPPRYVPVARLRQTMKTAKIENLSVSVEKISEFIEVEKLYTPVVTSKAEIIEGTPEETARKIYEILTSKGIISKK